MSPTWVGILGDVAPTVMNGILADWNVGPGREDGVGVGVADHQRDLVLLDELLRRLGRDVHLVLAVVDDEVDLRAEDAAGRVDLLDRELRAVRRRQVERGLVAGQGEPAADLDRAAGAAATAGGRRGRGATRGEDEDEGGRQREDAAGHGSSSGSTRPVAGGILTSMPRAVDDRPRPGADGGHTIPHRPADDKDRSGRESGAPCQYRTRHDRRSSSSRWPRPRTRRTRRSSAAGTTATSTRSSATGRGSCA